MRSSEYPYGQGCFGRTTPQTGPLRNACIRTPANTVSNGTDKDAGRQRMQRTPRPGVSAVPNRTQVGRGAVPREFRPNRPATSAK